MPRSRIERWNTAYAALNGYRKEHPGEWPFWSYVAPDGLRLGGWCKNQRIFHRMQVLARDRVQKLESIGFPWQGVALTAAWERAFEALKRFREKHGYCRAPEDYTGSGIRLPKWCRWQRRLRKAGLLSKDRVKKLESIGFEWELYDAAWDRGFAALKLYRRKNPDTWPRAIEVLPNGFKLGSWCYKQRQRRKQGIVPRDRIQKLDSMDFEWEPEEALWQRAFAALKNFRKRYPDRWPSANCAIANGIHLGKWCRNKRQAIKRGVLSENHLRQLREIGFK